jgi:DNA primase
MVALSKERRRLLERATLQYAKHLDEAADALEARGLDLEHARSSGLGVVKDAIPGHEHLEGRLAIPYLTDAGPVNMTFRCIQDHNCKEVSNHSKYMFLKGFQTNLYGVQSAEWADEWIVVCEGEIDALTWHQIGVPAFGVSGVEKWQPWWSNVLDDFSRIYVAEDGDEAGKKLWDKVSFETNNAIRMRMPDGEDTNSMFVKAGKDYLLGRIKK